MKINIVIALFAFCSCADRSSKTAAKPNETKEVHKDTTLASFTISGSKKITVDNGESIQHYSSGAIKMRGMMKDGHRSGIWKSWYENGTPWSETTFLEGRKTGKTITWYENGKKRYEGFYTNDIESGKWVYWNEEGKIATTKDFGSN